MSVAWGLSFGAPSAWGASWGTAGAVQAVATGPQVILIPHEPIYFRTRGDFALFALASFTKQEALRTRERYPRPMGERRVPVHL